VFAETGSRTFRERTKSVAETGTVPLAGRREWIGLCAVVFLVLAVLAFVTLRDVPLIGTQPDQDDMTTREPKGLVA
jgi:hypothetical protein